MHPTVVLTFTLALAVAVAIPGPGILSVVSCALARGFRVSLALIVGMILGDLVYFSLAVFGLAALARGMGEFFLIVKWVGAAYLVWLGLQLWRHAPAAVSTGASPEVPGDRGYRRTFTAGVLVTISNPKAIGFYAGLLPTVVDLEHLTVTDGAIMAGIVVLTVGSIPAAYALLAAKSRRFFQSAKRLRLMNRTAGTVLIGSGITVATR